MQTTELKKELQQYIDKGDDKLLKLMYALAKEYNEENDTDFALSEAEAADLYERRNKRINKESKVCTRDEAAAIITGKAK